MQISPYEALMSTFLSNSSMTFLKNCSKYSSRDGSLDSFLSYCKNHVQHVPWVYFRNTTGDCSEINSMHHLKIPINIHPNIQLGYIQQFTKIFLVKILPPNKFFQCIQHRTVSWAFLPEFLYDSSRRIGELGKKKLFDKASNISVWKISESVKGFYQKKITQNIPESKKKCWKIGWNCSESPIEIILRFYSIC